MPIAPPTDLRRRDDALDAAFHALDAAPGDIHAKVALARLLKRAVAAPVPEHAPRLHALLVDPDVDPRAVARAGWALLLAQDGFSGDPAVDAGRLEDSELAQALLAEALVVLRDVEIALTRVRRWLLLSGRSEAFPRSVAALVRQAAHNDGAWLFDEEERARLTDADSAALRLAYLPPRPKPVAAADFASPVTQAVAGQYDAWPFPSWQRTMAGTGESFAAFIARFGPGSPRDMPEDARLLVAGCGSGSEPVMWARQFPRLRITAIDISRTALDYAAARAAEAGVDSIRFELLDLHDVASLDTTFDVVTSCGVLHHLPNPEAGWAALCGVLRPGGAMRIMLYSKLGRLTVNAAKARIADLAMLPVDDDLLRAVRARFIDAAVKGLLDTPIFYHLGGVFDLFLHRHEDPFDIPRIARATETLGLGLLRFQVARDRRGRYRAQFPDDPYFRDYASRAAFERNDFPPSAAMYDIWCTKPA